MAKINHCGKSFAAQNRFVVTNYPGNGDMTYFDYAKCEVCKNSVHTYWIVYFRASVPTIKAQSDKHDRGKYDDLIRQGQAVIIPTHQDEVPRDTKAQVLACEWSLEVMSPADITAVYLNKNERAPWVSTVSITCLEQKRAKWLADFRHAKRGIL